MGPKPQLEHPGRILARVFSYVFKGYLLHVILVAVCIVVSVLANVRGTLFLSTLIDEYITPLLDAQGKPVITRAGMSDWD